MAAVGRFGARAWRDLGADAALLERVDPIAPAVSLASRLDVIGMAGDAVALAVLAVHEVMLHRGLSAHLPRVRVDGARLATSIQSERHARVAGRAPQVWAPLSGFWRAADGWVRTHGNYPHHAQRLRAVLDLGAEADTREVAAAIEAREAQWLEDAAAEHGAVAARVRTSGEWSAHPQAAAVASMPLVSTASVAAAPPRAWAASPSAPLEGIRVLDLTRVIAGPVASRDLAFAGADVLRVDPPGMPELSWQHLDSGQGKRSTLLDLAGADRARFEGLLEAADVVVVGYRPGGLARLGFEVQALLRRHPGLVVGTVSAWGPSGPWAQRRGFDSIVQAASGIAMIESDDGTTPGALPAQALDHSTGHLLAAGIIRALGAQRREGGSRLVSVALARVAQELLAGGSSERKRRDEPGEPTVQHGADGSACALPVLTFEGAPPQYPRLARPWGGDAARW